MVSNLGGTPARRHRRRFGDGRWSSPRFLFRSKGGRAVANYDASPPRTARRTSSRPRLMNSAPLHGVVSAPGRATARYEPRSNWDAVLKRCTFYGGYRATRGLAAFREQSYGRVVVATSTGLFGNFSPADQPWGKLGLVGLINTLAGRGPNYLIHANTLDRGDQDDPGHPAARSTELTPEFVAPVVACLCTEECADNSVSVVAGAASCAVGNDGAFDKPSVQMLRRGEDFTDPTCENCWIQVVEVNEGLCRKKNFPAVRHGITPTSDEVSGDGGRLLSARAAGSLLSGPADQGRVQLKLAPPFVPGMESGYWCVQRRRMRVSCRANVFQHSRSARRLHEQITVPVTNVVRSPVGLDAGGVSLLVNWHHVLRLARRAALRAGARRRRRSEHGRVQIAKAMQAE